MAVEEGCTLALDLLEHQAAEHFGIPQRHGPGQGDGRRAADHRRRRMCDRKGILGHEEQLVDGLTAMLQRGGGFGIEQEIGMPLQVLHAAGRSGGESSNGLDVGTVIADEDDRFRRIPQHLGKLVAIVAVAWHITRDADGHDEVNLRQGIAYTQTVSQVRQLPISALAAARVKIAQRVGAGAEVYPLTVKTDSDLVAAPPVKIERPRRRSQRPFHQRRWNLDKRVLDQCPRLVVQPEPLFVEHTHPCAAQDVARSQVNAQAVLPVEHGQTGAALKR